MDAPIPAHLGFLHHASYPRFVRLFGDLLPHLPPQRKIREIDLGCGADLDNLAALRPEKLVPGRGAALVTPEQVQAGLSGTRAFIADVYDSVKAGVAAGKDLNAVYKDTYARLAPKYGKWVIFDHCMPFDVTRCYDEATQYPDPRIWTAERDRQMWAALET